MELKPFEGLSRSGKWDREHPECSREWHEKHSEYMREKRIEWNIQHPEYRSNYRRKLKLKAMQKVSGLQVPECRGCGCDDIRMLQINHKNGDGYAERKAKKDYTGNVIYRAIISGERPAEDLDVMCGVCNWKHYYEMRYGHLLFEVRYLGSAMQCSGKEE